MATEQGTDVAKDEATAKTTETPAVTQAPAAEVKTETPAPAAKPAQAQNQNKNQKATPTPAPAEPAPVELVAKATPIELIRSRYNFTEETTPEVISTIDGFLNTYEALIVDKKYNTQDELKELSGKLVRSFGAALNLTGATANAALDLIVFHFAGRSSDVYTRVNLFRTPKALAGQVDRNVRFVHALARLFTLLSVATVKSSVSKDIDLPKVYEVLRSQSQQATLAAYLA